MVWQRWLLPALVYWCCIMGFKYRLTAPSVEPKVMIGLFQSADGNLVQVLAHIVMP